MPKAKTLRGVRLTQRPHLSCLPRRKEDGRPKGTRKKYKFEQTPLGFMLLHEVPQVYEIIMRMTPKSMFPEPRIRTIEIVCRASGDPSLRKSKFFRYLELYRKDGICCRRPRVLTDQRARYYESIRKRKLAKYINRNREQVEKERKKLQQQNRTM